MRQIRLRSRTVSNASARSYRQGSLQVEDTRAGSIPADISSVFGQLSISKSPNIHMWVPPPIKHLIYVIDPEPASSVVSTNNRSQKGKERAHDEAATLEACEPTDNSNVIIKGIEEFPDAQTDKGSKPSVSPLHSVPEEDERSEVSDSSSHASNDLLQLEGDSSVYPASNRSDSVLISQDRAYPNSYATSTMSQEEAGRSRTQTYSPREKIKRLPPTSLATFNRYIPQRT